MNVLRVCVRYTIHNYPFISLTMAVNPQEQAGGPRPPGFQLQRLFSIPLYILNIVHEKLFDLMNTHEAFVTKDLLNEF